MQGVQLFPERRVSLLQAASRGRQASKLKDRRASDLELSGGTSFGNKGPQLGPFSVLSGISRRGRLGRCQRRGAIRAVHCLRSPATGLIARPGADLRSRGSETSQSRSIPSEVVKSMRSPSITSWISRSYASRACSVPPKVSDVAEAHVRLAEMQRRARHLGQERRRDAAGIAQLEGEVIVAEGLGDLLAVEREHPSRRLLEGNGQQVAVLGHALAGAQIEGDAVPAPVVDEGPQGNEGLGVGVLAPLPPPSR